MWQIFLLVFSACLAWVRARNECPLNERNDGEAPLRVCYYTTWARYRPAPFNMAVEHFDPRMCSHVIIAFAWITGGRLDFHSEYDDKPIFQELVRFKKHYPRLKVLAAVGGWNFGSGPFQEVVASEESRRLFVESSIQFLETWALDGLDLDWEYPEARERANLTALIQATDVHVNSSSLFVKRMKAVQMFRFAFDQYAAANGEKPFLLTAAVPAAKSRMDGYDVPKIKDHLDFINIMAYDLHGPWDKKTGHNAPMHSDDGLSVINGVEMWSDAGMPRKRMIVGMPTYGHSFQLAKPWANEVGATAYGGVSGTYTRTSGFFAFYEVCEFLNEEGTQLYWDRKGGMLPYAVLNDTWLSYDNQISLQKKVQWTLESGLGGVMIWSLALDDFGGYVCSDNLTFPLLRAINAYLDCHLPPGPVPDDVIHYVTAIRNEPKPWEKKVWWTPPPTTTTTTTTTTQAPQPRRPSSGSGGTRRTGVNWDLVEQRVLEANLNAQKDKSAKQLPRPAATADLDIKIANECDWDNDFRRGDNCSHFVRCERGKLHSFICPPGLAFHEGDSICRWPRFVPDCLHLTPPPTTTTPEPSTAEIPTLPQEPIDSEQVESFKRRRTTPERRIHYNFEVWHGHGCIVEVLGEPTEEQEKQYDIFTLVGYDDPVRLDENGNPVVFSVFRGT